MYTKIIPKLKDFKYLTKDLTLSEKMWFLWAKRFYKPIKILFLPFEYLDFILDSTRHNQLCLRRQVAAIVFPHMHIILNFK